MCVCVCVRSCACKNIGFASEIYRYKDRQIKIHTYRPTHIQTNIFMQHRSYVPLSVPIRAHISHPSCTFNSVRISFSITLHSIMFFHLKKIIVQALNRTQAADIRAECLISWLLCEPYTFSSNSQLITHNSVLYQYPYPNAVFIPLIPSVAATSSH